MAHHDLVDQDMFATVATHLNGNKHCTIIKNGNVEEI